MTTEQEDLNPILSHRIGLISYDPTAPLTLSIPLDHVQDHTQCDYYWGDHKGLLRDIELAMNRMRATNRDQVYEIAFTIAQYLQTFCLKNEGDPPPPDPSIPTFHWENSIEEAADAINRDHQDYPARVPDTVAAIQSATQALRANPAITISLIRSVHRQVFPDHGAGAGHWRTVDIKADHPLAKSWQIMDERMEDLEQYYRASDLGSSLLQPGVSFIPIPNLENWYLNFRIIHPLLHGNSRTAAIIVAAASFLGDGEEENYLSADANRNGIF